MLKIPRVTSLILKIQGETGGQPVNKFRIILWMGYKMEVNKLFKIIKVVYSPEKDIMWCFMATD